MASPVRTRLAAALMLLLFLAGSLGVSSIDAILYHLSGQDEVPLVHVEAADANCHAAACVVGFAVNEGRFFAAPSDGIILRAALQTAQRQVHPVRPLDTTRSISSLPRAPPLTL